MPKPVKKPFVFNDETVENTYGFSISTDGIDLTRFEKNPVMLSDHWNSNWNVIGKWSDLIKEGATLSGLPDFDTEDKDTAIIAGKVDRGYINACSMGIIFDRENLIVVAGKVILTKCELLEVSIVPVPSNANAVRLLNADGKVLDEKEIKELALSIIPAIKNPELNLNIDNMKKIILSVPVLMALGFKDQPTDGLDVSDVEAKVLSLNGQVTTLTKENEGLKLAAQKVAEATEAARKESVTKKVELGITQGKFKADQKEEMITLGLSSESALDTVLASIPAKTNLGADIKTPVALGVTEVKTMDDFQKLGTEAQLAFKNDFPEEYKKIVG